MHSFTEFVNAVKAREYITGSDTKRSASPTVVRTYVRDMLNEEWRLIHAGLAFRDAAAGEAPCQHGVMIDGKQRMMAVIVADRSQPGIEVPFYITTGVPGDVFDAIDSGRKRSIADVLQIRGVGTANYSQLGAVGRRAILLQRGEVWTSGYVPSRNEIVDYIRCHPAVTTASDTYAARRFPRVLNVARSVAGLSYWVLGSLNRDAAEAYLEAIRLGAELTQGGVALYLRNRLMAGELYAPPQRKKDRDTAPQAMHYRGKEPELTLALLMLGWEKWLDGSRVSILRMPGHMGNNSFPVPAGLRGWQDPVLSKSWE